VSAGAGSGPEPGDLAPPGASAALRWGFGDVAVALLGAIVVGNALAVVLFEMKGHSSPAAQAWMAVAVLVGPWCLLGGWPAYAARRKGSGPVRDFGLRLGWRSAAVGVLGGVAGLLCASAVAEVQVTITGHGFDARVTSVAQHIVAASRPALVLFALATAFGAPVVEELAFRGLTFGAFRKVGQPVVWATVWTTVLFAAFHFEPVRLPVLLVLGGWLGAVRAYTGSTAASMVAHMTVNIPGAVLILGLH
jgi:membrane protease YdiL (CAAX protease family)